MAAEEEGEIINHLFTEVFVKLLQTLHGSAKYLLSIGEEELLD